MTDLERAQAQLEELQARHMKLGGYVIELEDRAKELAIKLDTAVMFLGRCVAQLRQRSSYSLPDGVIDFIREYDRAAQAFSEQSRVKP